MTQTALAHISLKEKQNHSQFQSGPDSESLDTVSLDYNTGNDAQTADLAT